MIDGHFHLNYLPAEGFSEQLMEARRRGVHGGLVAGVWTQDTEQNLAWAKVQEDLGLHYFLKSQGAEIGARWRRQPFFGVFLAHGLHPLLIHKRWLGQDGRLLKQAQSEDSQRFKDLLAEFADAIWAIGETGFDLSREVLESIAVAGIEKRAILDLQHEAFLMCVEVALQYTLPLIIHSRGAWAHTLSAVDAALGAGVRSILIHCYGGPAEDVGKLGRWGVKLSFGGVATWTKARKVRAAAVACPEASFVLETDSPDLSPEYDDGSRPPVNHPRELPFIAQQIARQRGVTPEVLADCSDRNVAEFLGLPKDTFLGKGDLEP